MTLEKFTDNEIESISKIIGHTNEGVSGTELTRLLAQINIDDTSTETKWKRIYRSLKMIQMSQDSPNNIIQFIQNVMEPSRFFDKPNAFHNLKSKLNSVLLLKGLMVNSSGKINISKKANTLDEAHQRANELKRKLHLRAIHSSLLKYCEVEYLQKNYYHAVFEAVKSILDRLREMTGQTEDGIPLVLKVLDEKKPKISINKYQTSSEQNELMGLRSIIIGLVKMVRNPLAHELKVNWVIEEKEALDILTMVSFIHRQLDESYRTGY